MKRLLSILLILCLPLIARAGVMMMGGGVPEEGAPPVTPDILNETFEGTGYSVPTWSETVGSGCTINEDYDATTVTGAPANWLTQCLQIQSATLVANNTLKYLGSQYPITYTRVEIIFSAWSVASGPWLKQILFTGDTTGNQVWTLSLQKDASNNYHFYTIHYTGGTDVADASAVNLALNTLYRVEVKYDVTNSAWDWKINGVSEGAAAMTAAMRAGLQAFRLGTVTTSEVATYTLYYDRVGIDANEWIGE